MSEAQGITIPYVHLNGTGKESLLNQRLDAARAVNAAIEALTQMYPHMRDYYLDQTGERWRAAVAQHERRLEVLRSLNQELITEVEMLYEVTR